MSSNPERRVTGSAARRASPADVSWGVACLAAAAATMAAMSGCCGGAPAHACKFVETPKDAAMDQASDSNPPCGLVNCEPGKTYCCFQQSPPSLGCIPVTEICRGQSQVCSGDADCVPGSGLHCCLAGGVPQTQCLEQCSGDPNVDGTLRVCSTNTECPPDRPVCGKFAIGGGNVPACIPLSGS